jgi:hypothetical protein
MRQHATTIHPFYESPPSSCVPIQYNFRSVTGFHGGKPFLIILE